MFNQVFDRVKDVDVMVGDECTSGTLFEFRYPGAVELMARHICENFRSGHYRVPDDMARLKRRVNDMGILTIHRQFYGDKYKTYLAVLMAEMFVDENSIMASALEEAGVFDLIDSDEVPSSAQAQAGTDDSVVRGKTDEDE